MKNRRYAKNYEPLLDPSWEQVVSREPLLAFSFALSTRNNQLAKIADEILDELDIGFANEGIDSSRITKAGILIWLWSLGAYEVVRTMCQAKSCFSTASLARLNSLKRSLAKVRMPEAKMEKVGKPIPVSSDRSPWCEDISAKDLLIGDPDDAHSARALLDEYFLVMNSITASDIIARHEASYSKA